MNRIKPAQFLGIIVFISMLGILSLAFLAYSFGNESELLHKVIAGWEVPTFFMVAGLCAIID